MEFIVIETDDGLQVVEQDRGETADAVAVRHGGVVVDAGPYPTLEEANDALINLQRDDFDEQEAEGLI